MTATQTAEIDYDELAMAVARRIQLLPPQKEVLWDTAACADYLGVSRVHFTDRLSKGRTFPRPFKLPSDTGKKAHSRWYASEVIAWVKKHRQAS